MPDACRRRASWNGSRRPSRTCAGHVCGAKNVSPSRPAAVRELLRAHGRAVNVERLEREPRRFGSPEELEGFLRRQLWIEPRSAADGRFRAALGSLIEINGDGRAGLIGAATVADRHRDLGAEGGETRDDDGRDRPGWPALGPSTRWAAWRAWLIANHTDVNGRLPRDMADATGQTRCLIRRRRRGGAVRRLGQFEGRQARRRTLDPVVHAAPPRSGWSRPNKERIERLTAAGLMLPAGIAVIEEAKRLGTWELLDAVEDLVVPRRPRCGVRGQPRRGAHWDGFSRSARRGDPRMDRAGQAAGDAGTSDRRDGDAGSARREGKPVGPTVGAAASRRSAPPVPRRSEGRCAGGRRRSGRGRRRPGTGTVGDPFAGEAGLLERALLSDVLDVVDASTRLASVVANSSSAASRWASVPSPWPRASGMSAIPRFHARDWDWGRSARGSNRWSRSPRRPRSAR